MAATSEADSQTLQEVNAEISRFTKASGALIQSIRNGGDGALTHLDSILVHINAIAVKLPEAADAILGAACELETITRAEVEAGVAPGSSRARIFSATATVAAEVKAGVTAFLLDVQEEGKRRGTLDHDVINTRNLSLNGSANGAAVMEKVINSHLQQFARVAGEFIQYISSTEALTAMNLLQQTKKVLEAVAMLHDTLEDDDDKERLQMSSQTLVRIVRGLGTDGGSVSSHELKAALIDLISTVKEATRRYLDSLKESAADTYVKQPLGFATFDVSQLVTKKEKPALPPRPKQMFKEERKASLSQIRRRQVTPKKVINAPATPVASDEATTAFAAMEGDDKPGRSRSSTTVPQSISYMNRELAGIKAAEFEGWLTKQGGSIKTWRRRYFVLRDLRLLYFKTQTDFLEGEEPLGEILVPNYELSHAPDCKKDHAFKLSHPPGRTYIFAADNDTSKRVWMEVLGDKGLVPTAARREPASETAMMVQREEDGSVVIENGSVVLVYDGFNRIVAGTMESLLMRLADENERDDDFVRTFLMGFRHFMDGDTEYLLECLIARYHIEPPPNATAAEIAYVNEHKEKVQVRVLEVIVSWLDAWYKSDFQCNGELVERLLDFLTSISADASEATAEGVEAVHAMLQECQDRSEIPYPLQDMFRATPNESDRDGFVATLDPVCLAQQLTFMDMKLFQAIDPSEFALNLWDSSDRREALIANLLNFVERFNQTSWWVATEICLTPDAVKRAQVLKTFVLTAMHAYKLGNFNTMFAIVTGLNTSPIQRLKKSWGALSNKTVATMHKMEQFMDPTGNYKTYRDALRESGLPSIPFFGLYIKDLTFMNDGNPKKLESGLINFDKLRLIHDVVEDIRRYQASVYTIEHDTTTMSYFSRVSILDEKVLYEYSLLCEPRVKDKSGVQQDIRLIEKWMAES